MKGPVEKGVSDDLRLKSNIGTQAGFHVRNAVAHLFLDLRSKI